MKVFRLQFKNLLPGLPSKITGFIVASDKKELLSKIVEIEEKLKGKIEVSLEDGITEFSLDSSCSFREYLTSTSPIFLELKI